jgi:uncharacterized membrane protein YfcA
VSVRCDGCLVIGGCVIEFPIGEILYASGIFWIAGSLQGLTGFGFNLLAVPALVLWFPAQVVVPGVLMSYLPLGVGQFVQLRKDVDWKLLGMMVGSAIVGMPLGASILRDTDTEVMKRGIGIAMIVLAIVLQFRPGKPFQKETPARLGIGLLSGFLSSSIGVSGPPLVLLGVKQLWPQAKMRATLLTHFLCASTVSLGVLWVVGVATFESVQFVVWGAPGLILGFLTATWLRAWVHRTSIFRWITIGMVMTGGLAAAIF